MRSEEEPRSDKGHVRTLVGTTFDRIKGDVSKDVLVMFESNGCNLCEIFLEESMEPVAKRFSRTRGLVFARINMNKNEVKGLSVDYYPTVMFYSTK